MQDFWDQQTDEYKLQHGQKSLTNRTIEGIKAGAEKQKITKSNWSPEYKAKIESTRRSKWDESYCNTQEKVNQRAEKCSRAGDRRKMYFITYQLESDDSIHEAFFKDMLDEGFKRDGIRAILVGKTDLHKPLKLKHLDDTLIIISFTKLSYSSIVLS